MALKVGSSPSTSAGTQKQSEPTSQPPPEQIKESATPSSQPQSDLRQHQHQNQQHQQQQHQAQHPRPPLERIRTLSFSEPIRPSRSKDQSWSTIPSPSSSTLSQPQTPENDGRAGSPPRSSGRKTRSPSPYPGPQGPPSDDEDEASDGEWKPRKLFASLASRGKKR